MECPACSGVGEICDECYEADCGGCEDGDGEVALTSSCAECDGTGEVDEEEED